jgi:succinyldiaminopimelate transaminase
VPAVIAAALDAASNAPGYPLTAGSVALRSALSAWVSRSCGTAGPSQDALARASHARSRTADGFGVLPTIGSKEFIAWLPTLLGLGPGDVVVVPQVCYPTYEVGALMAGATVVRSDSLTALGPSSSVRLIWINSPSNPTGRVLPAAHLRKVVDWARERGAVVASDECYLPLPWDAAPVSVLSVCESSFAGVLAVHSLSKRSNLAGYRAGFVAGDPALIGELLTVRKHAGMIVPDPVQAAMIAALGDEAHVVEQRARYGRRRTILRSALLDAGFTIDNSEAGLYLWVTRDQDCWAEVDWFAARGILVAPGDFYGPAGGRHVRVALTATDERVDSAAARIR